MHRNLDLATLRTLLAVADTGGMTKAANQLHLTQSTVSMQMKRLEEQLDLTLLERDGRKMKLTPEGEMLSVHARKLIDLNDDAMTQLTVPKHEGTLSFGVPYDIVEPHIPSILKQFVREFPKVAVSLTTGLTVNLRESYDAGELDVILTTELEPGKDGVVLLRNELKWNGAINGRAWRQRPLPLTFTHSCMFRKPALEALEKAEIEWVDAVDTAGGFFAGSIAGSADLGITADLKGFSAAGMEPIEDPEQSLPALPEYCVAMYTTDGPNRDIANAFSSLIKNGFEQTDLTSTIYGNMAENSHADATLSHNNKPDNDATDEDLKATA